jgi:hypothetical protein
MVKTVKIWLILLPIILVIGVLLYMQSFNNQKELENQLIRSVEASKNDIVRALSDYYTRVDAHFIRLAYAEAANANAGGEKSKEEARKVSQIIKMDLNYFNPRLLDADSIFDDSLRFKNGLIRKNGLIINLENLDSDFEFQSLREAFEINSTEEEDLKKSFVVDLEIPISELLRKQETNKIFDHFFITFKDGTTLYPPEEAGIKLFLPQDVEIDTSQVTHSGTHVLKINYSQKSSRGYVTPIPMENQRLYAVGLISEDTYQSVGMRLDFGKLSMLILFLLILIALIPILGVMNLSSGDNLTQSKVTQVGISLLCLTIIIGYSISQFRNESNPVEEQKPIVDELEKGLSDTLGIYKNTLEKLRSYSHLDTLKANFNEVIAFKPTGYAEKIYFRNVETGTKLIDFTGVHSATDLRQREYFTFYEDKTKQKVTFLDSHYSRSDGQLESVISRNFDQDFPKSELKGINSITFKFKADSTLSKQYRFLLMKKDGKILLKSDKISSPIAKLQEGINSEKWRELSSLMENNAYSDSQMITSLYLNGNSYTGILKRLKKPEFDENIWLFFLVNENVSHAFASLSSAESISLLSFYFLSLLLSLFIQKYSKRSVDKQGTKAFLYSWLEPNSHNLPRLNYLTIAYLFYAAGLILTYYWADITHIDMLLLLIYSSFLISFVNLSTSINSLTFDDFTEFRVQRYSMRSIILAGVTLVIFFFIVIWNFQIVLPTISLTVLASGIIAGWFLIFKPKATFEKTPKSITLPAFLGVWFVVIGFLPGYFLQSKTQIYEQILWDTPAPKTYIEGDKPDSYYKAYEIERRKFLTWISDPFDQKIENFIAPSQQVFKMAMDRGAMNRPIFTRFASNVLIIITLLILFILFINIIQQIIFYPFFSLTQKSIDFSTSKLFLCCSKSEVLTDLIKKNIKGAKMQIINLLDADISNKDLIDLGNTHFHLQNIHCLKNQLDIIPILNVLIDMNKSIIISSGKNWNELFILIKEIDDQVIYAETFTEFEFHMIPINLQSFKAEPNVNKHVLIHQAENEDKMQLRIAQFADIWSELNFQEKLICYSFSLERFLNKSRKNGIQELIRKGILIKAKAPSISEDVTENSIENTLEAEEMDNTSEWRKYEFFSRLFQTYILIHVSKEEIKSFKDFESKHGNSKMIQISAVSFVLICFALISIFDKTFLNEIYAYLTGTLGLLGSLYTILNRGFSGFKFGKSESST